jgi:hypothetical protein
MNIIYDCEAYGVEPPQEKYIMLICESGIQTYTWFGRRALYLHPGAIPHDQGMSYGNFVCCGLTLNVTSYSDNSNVTNYFTNNTTNTNVTNYFTNNTTNTNVTNYFTNNTSNTNVTNYFTNNTTSNHLSDLSSNSNVTNYFTNNTLTTYLSQFISSDNYSEYALIMSGVSLLISITLVIVSMVISCRNCAESRALRYMMYNRTPNPQIPIRVT